MLQRNSIDLREAVATAEGIVTEMKCLRQNTEHEFYRLSVSAQDTAQKHNSIQETPRRASRNINGCHQ